MYFAENKILEIHRDCVAQYKRWKHERINIEVFKGVQYKGVIIQTTAFVLAGGNRHHRLEMIKSDRVKLDQLSKSVLLKEIDLVLGHQT